MIDDEGRLDALRLNVVSDQRIQDTRKRDRIAHLHMVLLAQLHQRRNARL